MQVRWTTCKCGGLHASAVAKNNEPKAHEFVSLGVRFNGMSIQGIMYHVAM